MHSIHHHTDRPSAHGQHIGPQTEGRIIRWARLYDPLVWVMALGQTRRLRSIPLELANIRPGERVLDIGCGTGDLTLAAARRTGPTGSVWGIDASLQMIEVATRKAHRAGHSAHNVRFEVEAVEALSFQDGSFDVVMSSLMMHHLPGDLKSHALVEIRRVLRPGGRLLVVDFQQADSAHRSRHGGGPLLWVHKRPRRHEVPSDHSAEHGPGLADLAALARREGFAPAESGPTDHPWLGYMRAQAPL